MTYQLYRSNTYIARVVQSSQRFPSIHNDGRESSAGPRMDCARYHSIHCRYPKVNDVRHVAFKFQPGQVDTLNHTDLVDDSAERSRPGESPGMLPGFQTLFTGYSHNWEGNITAS